MANKKAKISGNVEGQFYVDDQCIGCNACVTEAPEHFVMNDDAGVAYVMKQPTSTDDKKKCENALAACPVEAIGRDG